VRVRAFAKINLSLRVLGRRPDGYHELRTMFQSIALHDTLTIRRVRGPFTLTCDDSTCPGGRDNLVWRAAEKVWRAAGRRGPPRGVAIHLSKGIPMQAGLGGGSSDAAAAIRALAKTWGLRDEQRQHALAASLGADVPYFLEGGTVLGVERGDVLFPLTDRSPAWVVLVIPPFGVSTKQAFGWFDRAGDSPRLKRPSVPNDFERVVGERHPEIRRSIRALRSAGASLATLSGSGAAVFGLFSRRPEADAAAAELWAPGRRTIVTRTIDRRTCRRLAAK